MIYVVYHQDEVQAIFVCVSDAQEYMEDKQNQHLNRDGWKIDKYTHVILGDRLEE